MGIFFANGRNILPSNSWNITVNSTGGNLVVGSYYFSLQARNRVGLTLPLYSSLITVANNNSITITINSTAKETGEEWISYVISANTINQPLSYCQIAEIPLINLNDNSLNSFPLVINLTNTEHLALNKIVANNTLLPTTNAIHGMLRGLNSTSLIYKYDIFDTTTPQDTLYVFNGISGKWKATGRFTTYIQSVTDIDGCSQDIRDITDPSNIIVPKYNPNGNSSNTILLWLTSSKIVKAGTRIAISVKLGNLNKSQLFDGLLELKFKGFVNTTTGIKRITKSDNITPLDEIDVLYKYDANNPTLLLEDDLAVGEAYALEVNCNFQSAEIEDYVVNGSYISIYPEFTASASIYNPAGVIIGDVIFNDSDKRRIVPNLGLTAIALKGSGLIKNFSFPVQEESTVTALNPNSTNLVAINKLGNVYVTSSLPSDAVQRSIVKTIAGESNPSVWSSNVSVSASGSLSITVNYPCSTDGYGTIRSDYPDVIAGNNKGKFNPTKINLYIDNGTVIKKFTNNAVIPGTNQIFTISDYSLGTTSTLPSNSDNTFSLFAPSTITLAASTGGNFSAGSYKVAYSFVYTGNEITTISHKESDGNVPELTFNLLDALQRFKYVWLNGSGVPSNSLGYNDNYYLDNITKNYYNKVNDSWVLVGSLRGNLWINGTVNPTSSDGILSDYYINTTSYEYFKKTTNTVWTSLGNIKGISGAVWLNGSGVPGSGIGVVGDYYLNNTTSDYYTKTNSTTWSLLGSFKGITGTAGATWITGTITPTSGIGVTNDLYLNTVTYDFYLKTNSTTWTLQGNLKGITGASGTLSSNSGIITDNNTVAPTITSTQIAVYSKSGIATIVNNSGTENTIAYIDKQQTYSKAQGTALNTLTYGATITPDFSNSNTYKVSLTGNTTIANGTNTVSGFTYSLIIQQDATGSRTITWGTNYKFPSNTAPTLTTTANLKDIVSFICDGTDLLYCGIQKGI